VVTFGAYTYGLYIAGVTESMFSKRKQILRMELFNYLLFVLFALIGNLWEWGGQEAIVFGSPAPGIILSGGGHFAYRVGGWRR
jgi:hypothetical protein